MNSEQKTIVICGDGLAGHLTAISLARNLGNGFHIVLVSQSENTPADIFYGSVTGPEGYNFLRSIGLDEPTLLLKSTTSFSYGTHYNRWLTSRPWLQCHHSPLPVLSGIPLRHHITRTKGSLEPLLITAQAARAGRFAHPPEDPNNPLSKAEYGYQFSPYEWTELLRQGVHNSRIEVFQSSIERVETKGDTLTKLSLSTGQEISGDLFIDATGPSRHCIRKVGGSFTSDRRISARVISNPTDQLGPPCRMVEATFHGWTSTTHLQNSLQTLMISHPEDGSGSTGHTEIDLGQLDEAWHGNVIAIGQAGSVLEPLTPAPMMVLQRDIERLLELIPASEDMSTERREFNRRFQLDVSHAKMFQTALLQSDSRPDSAYWQEAPQVGSDEGLKRKITQFENRGILVRYDLEPFNEEDWTISHLGMGINPRQYDRQADRIPLQQASQQLNQIRLSIENLVSKMPPHHIYMTRLKQYFEKNNHA